MNVLLITSTFPQSPHDNQVPWLAMLVRQLKKKGIKPTVYAPSYHGLKSHSYYSIPVIRFRYAPVHFEILTHKEGAVFKLRQKPWLFIVSFFYLIFGAYGIMHLRHRFKFDIVHVHWPFPNGLFGIIAKKLFHAKLVLTFHGAEFSLLRRVPLGTTILRFILRNSDKVVANSLFTKKLIQAIGPVKVSVIPFSSAVTIGKTQNIESSEISQNVYRILFVGRFIERKGIPFLIDAIDILHKKNTPVFCDIVGNGPLDNQIEEQIMRLNLDNYIKIHKGIDEANLSQFYRRCDVFVLPSIVDKWYDTEGLGVVLIEAMNFGKPVVASRVGGIPDVVKHNINGLLVVEKNSQSLANALEALYQKPKLRKQLGIQGQKYVNKHYNWKTILDKTIKLYKTT